MNNQFFFTYKLKGKETLIKKNLPVNRDLFFLRAERFYMQRDLYNLACVVFISERVLKKNRLIEEIQIPISPKTYKKIDVKSIEQNIQDLFRKVLLSEVRIKIVSKEVKFSKTRKKFKFDETDAICLFSGGVDSFSGLLNTKSQFKRVIPLFIAHSDQQGMISIINKMGQNLFKDKNIEIKTLHAPAIKKGGYSQLRGFLYFVLAGVYASLSKTKNIVITECAPTMYQPRFAPMDEITFTTHPKVLSVTKNILESFFGRVNIITPFENLTKAEVISISPDKENFEKTHSCITQRSRDHDGTCYGCVIRRLGSLLAGVKDTKYNYNLLSEDDSPKKSDNFVSLINMCYDILFDYERLPEFTKENIERYNKQDLFKRFSLDNFASLFIYYDMLNNKKSKFIEDIYKKAIIKLGEDAIKNRIKVVRAKSLLPDFKRVVK